MLGSPVIRGPWSESASLTTHRICFRVHTLEKDPKHQPRRRPVSRAETATKRSPPEWLPSPIVNFASSMALELDGGMLLRLQRLTTDSRMKFVWCWLDRETRTSFNVRIHPDRIAEFADAFLCGYLYTAMWADLDAAYLRSAPRAQEQAATMLRIRDAAQALVEALGDPLEFRKFTPWDRLDAVAVSARDGSVVDQELLDKFAKNTQGRYWSHGASQSPHRSKKVVPTNTSAFPPLQARALLGDLPSQLNGLVLLAGLSIPLDGAVQSKPPNNTRRLSHTVYARNLARHVTRWGLRARAPSHRQPGFPLNQILAITTTVALGLSGNERILADTIRKLITEDTKTAQPK